MLDEHPAKWMIWEGAPFEESIEKLKSIGINSIVFHPCSNTPEGDNFLDMMKKNTEHLRKIFK